MIRRRFSLWAAGAGAWPLAAQGQADSKPRRVGSLSVASRDATVPFYDAFIDGMRELGWAQGKNIEYRFLFADGHAERLDALAAELLAQPIDVVVVGPPQALRALQKATGTVPIVMANVSNAVGNRFIASLARPGGNITGITAQNEVVLGKLIEQLHAAAPLARRIAVLVNESNPSHRAFWEAAQAACAALGLVPLRVVASVPGQIDAALAQAQRERAQAVVVVADAMYLTERERLAALIGAARLPSAYGLREHVVAGGLLSYAADIAQNYRDAASYVDKILRGAKPADLPVAQPTRYQLALNLKTARALELTMPQSLLLQATEVIE
jgi:putative tryptophan/tyrosine transport system substrate-binding protein